DLQGVVSPDTHLYRVRKALKIEKIIRKYDLSSSVVVPKKYLYFHNGSWHVIAEKLSLSPDVPETNKAYWRPIVYAGCQDLRIRNGLTSSAKPITSSQARALTILAFEAGLTDLTLGNLFFTPEGKIAIV